MMISESSGAKSDLLVGATPRSGQQPAHLALRPSFSAPSKEPPKNYWADYTLSVLTFFRCLDVSVVDVDAHIPPLSLR